ncbi:MAG: phage tail sheath family protein [Acidobacteriota bacterium]
MTSEVSSVPGLRRIPQANARPPLGLTRTDIAAFVGMTERGPLDRAVRLTSWEEYRRVFGGFQDFGYLPYAVRAYFENGGLECYVVRLTRHGSLKDSPQSAVYTVPAGWRVKGQLIVTAKAERGAGSVKALGPIPSAGAVLELGEKLFGIVKNVVAGVIEFQDTLPIDLPAGTELTWLDAGTLDSPAGVEESEIIVKAGLQLAKGDLVTIWGGGLSQTLPVRSVAGTTVHFAGGLKASFAIGSLVLPHVSALQLRAASPGSWGNRIQVRVTPIAGLPQRVDLRVTLEPGPEGGAPEREVFSRLNWNEDLQAAIEAVSNLIRIEKPTGSLLKGTREYSLQGGANGLEGLTLEDYLGDMGEDDHNDFFGLRLLEDLDDVGIVCLPDAVYLKPNPMRVNPLPKDPCHPQENEPKGIAPDPAPAVQFHADDVFGGALEHCLKKRYRVAIIDPPFASTAKMAGKWKVETFSQDSPLAKYGAMYFPWLEVPNPLARGRSPIVTVPPCGHAAGLYARTDLAKGVHHPPANGELKYAASPEIELSDEEHGLLNQVGVNGIRNFPGRGIRIWGARSLASNNSDPWQFIHARRLMSFIQHSVELAMQWTVFEPNDTTLRGMLVHQLTEFIGGIWRKGGLKGERPEEGFHVRCDESNNPQSVIDAGQIVCEVGVAIPAPMEFVVFEIRMGTGSVQVKDK